MGLGKRIQLARKEKGLTQVELAEMASISRSYLAGVEGERYNPSLDTLQNIAGALRTTSGVLLEDASTLEVLLDGQDGMDAARAMLERSSADKTPMSKKESDKWDKLFSAQEKVAPDDEERLVGLYRQMNTDGKEKLLETADDMVQSQKYVSASAAIQKRDGEKMA